MLLITCFENSLFDRPTLGEKGWRLSIPVAIQTILVTDSCVISAETSSRRFYVGALKKPS